MLRRQWKNHLKILRVNIKKQVSILIISKKKYEDEIPLSNGKVYFAEYDQGNHNTSADLTTLEIDMGIIDKDDNNT